MLFRRSLLVCAAIFAAGCGSTAASSSTTTDTAAGGDAPADTASSDSGPASDSGSGSDTAAASDMSAPADAIGGNVGNPSAGKAVTDAKFCSGCHGADFGGGGAGPNISPSANGTKDWTVADVKKAVKEGVNKKGKTLCATMQKYTDMTDQQILDLHAYLMSLAPVEAANLGPCAK